MNQDLLKIKKYYSENMAHLCRELFPSLLETEGLLYGLIDKCFAHSRFLYDDIIENNLVTEFKNYIYSQIENNRDKVIVNKTPSELLDEAGYVLDECKTEEDVEQFKKYYEENEALCTFNHIRNRLDYYHVFWAVKKDVDEIKRENFDNPKRQDEYGTSVMSIQFTKGGCNTLSIKNRYNHTVSNPDSTFSNNLDNIIPGLHNSFEKSYNLNINGHSKNNFEIPGYVPGNDGKFYKYNYEINNIYYCPDNIIIKNHEVIRDYQAKERYIVLDYFILDMKNKEIKLYDKRYDDSFPDTLKNIEKIQIKKEGEHKHICIKIGDNIAIITLDKQNRIISYQNDFVKTIGDNFLHHNKSLKALYMNNVEEIGNRFLANNYILKEIQARNLMYVGNLFLNCNSGLEEISFESLKKIGEKFLQNNKRIKKVYLPNVQYIGDNFLVENKFLDYIELPSVIKIGKDFIHENSIIKFVYMPYLEDVGKSFLYKNNGITYLSLPNLKSFEYFFMRLNKRLETIEFSKLEEFGKNSLEYAKLVNNIVVPENIRNSFIYTHKAFYKNFRTRKKDKNKIKTRQYCYN